MSNKNDDPPIPKMRSTRAQSRRFTTGLAHVARTYPAEVFIEWLMAIMEGHGQATMKRNEDTELGWCVSWPEHGEMASTMQEKQWAWHQWRLAAFGQPTETLKLEADIRASVANIGVSIPTGQLPPGSIHQLRELLRGSGQPSNQRLLPTLDVSASESASQPSNEDYEENDED